MVIDPHGAALKRQIRRAFSIGVLCVVVGASAIAGALWLGLDLTGIVLLATGIVVALLGLFLDIVGLYCSAVLFGRWIKTRFRRRPRVAATPAEPTRQAPASAPPSDGPRIF